MKHKSLIAIVLLISWGICVAETDRDNTKNVLHEYLRRQLMISGNNVTNKYSNVDTLCLFNDSTKQEIQKINKSFSNSTADSYIIVVGFSIDTLNVYGNYAIGEVSFNFIAKGNLFDNLKVYLRKTKDREKYILVKKNSKWYVAGFTGPIVRYTYWYIDWEDSNNTSSKGSLHYNNAKSNSKKIRKYITSQGYF